MLIRNAHAIVTGLRGEDARAAGPDIRVEDEVIREIGKLEPRPGEEQLDATDCVVYPGWVCTHHHLFQTLMKGVPEALDAALPEWLPRVPWTYRRGIDAKTLETAARVGLVELALSGCTTVADHHYVYYPGIGFDGAAILFEAAERIGLRLTLCRGGSTKPLPGYESADYLQPETADAMVADVERLVSRFHEPGEYARRRVALAPTTPGHRVRAEEMPGLAQAARRLGIRMHTHLSEDVGFVQWVEETYRQRPVDFCAERGWLGPDVWFAHLCHLDEHEIALLGRTRTGMAHCPGSNCRIGSGIAPAPQLAAAGAQVSLAVDGTASNEPGDMLSEVHLALYLHRAAQGVGALSVQEVVHWGSQGGAQVLGLRTGAVKAGFAADLAVYSLDEPRYFGFHDLAFAPVLGGGRPRLRRLMCGGRTVVERGEIPGLDLDELGARARRAVAQLRAV